MTGRHIDNATLRLWIDHVELGGYWSASDLRKQCCPGDSPDLVRYRLLRLVKNCMARRRRNANGTRDGCRIEYGVTTTCAAPPGYEHHINGTPHTSPQSGAQPAPAPVLLPPLGDGRDGGLPTHDSIDSDTRIAPAPRYDRMRAPTLTSPPAAPLRAGANDHKRIASFGVHC